MLSTMLFGVLTVVGVIAVLGEGPFIRNSNDIRSHAAFSVAPRTVLMSGPLARYYLSPLIHRFI